MEQPELLRFLVTVLENLGLPYMVAGSLSSAAWGEPRFTYDIDLVVQLTGAKDLDPLLAALPPQEFYVSRDAALKAIESRTQFNMIHPSSGQKVDIIIPGPSPWAQTQLARRQRVGIIEGVEAYTASPVDVVISKLLYYAEGGSAKHLRDIAGVLKISGARVDFAAIDRWAAELGLADVWNEAKKELGVA